MTVPATISFPEAAKSQVPAKFLWVDQTGQQWPTEMMETRHLFYSLRMIWNHRMPEEAKLHPYRRYDLRRSDEYLREAIRELTKELVSRKDMTTEWQVDLNYMINWLSTHQLENNHEQTKIEEKTNE